ncbi:hypothetical protein D3C84_443440 [compost metagenome]
MHAAGRLVGGQQQVAVEQRIGRLQVADVRRAQATGVRHLVEHRLGHPLLGEQVLVVPGDQVALLQHGVLQPAQAVQSLDLGFQDHPVVGLGEEVIATRLQAAHQGLVLGERGEEDDRHQGFARQLLDPARRLEAVHHRHQGIHQHQLRLFRLEQRNGLTAIGGGQGAVALAVDYGGEQQPVRRIVLGNQDRQRRGHGDGPQAIWNSCSKLEMARILRTSGVQLARRICARSPPAWSRSRSSMPRAELSR